MMGKKSSHIIAFNGEIGAFADLAARQIFPNTKTLPCASFLDAVKAVKAGKASAAVIPIENSLAGRVMDVHHLLPESGLHIINEHFQRIQLHVLGLKKANIKNIKLLSSQPTALAQCRNFISKNRLQTQGTLSTTRAIQNIIEDQNVQHAALGSSLAAELYDLKILAKNVEDADHNTTRFIVMAKDKLPKTLQRGKYITSFVFTVRNVPAALYKALGGFATNGINLLKLESYLQDGQFVAAQFYAEAETHMQAEAFQNALDELKFYTHNINLLGCYKSHPFRQQ